MRSTIHSPAPTLPEPADNSDRRNSDERGRLRSGLMPFRSFLRQGGGLAVEDVVTGGGALTPTTNGRGHHRESGQAPNAASSPPMSFKAFLRLNGGAATAGERKSD